MKKERDMRAHINVLIEKLPRHANAPCVWDVDLFCKDLLQVCGLVWLDTAIDLYSFIFAEFQANKRVHKTVSFESIAHRIVAVVNENSRIEPQKVYTLFVPAFLQLYVLQHAGRPLYMFSAERKRYAAFVNEVIRIAYEAPRSDRVWRDEIEEFLWREMVSDAYTYKQCDDDRARLLVEAIRKKYPNIGA